MLTGPDETLRHQLPTTFDHVGTSDPRFYDRYFFGVHDPDGRLALHIGLGLYTNMNVMDGYVAALVPRRDDAAGAVDQHNLRLSRALRPDIDTVGIGSYSIEILEPFRRARVSLPAGEHPVALDLEWTATAPAKEEEHHFRRLRGRVAADYHRYTIVGEASGWVRGRGHTPRGRPVVRRARPLVGCARAGRGAGAGHRSRPASGWSRSATCSRGSRSSVATSAATSSCRRSATAP